MRRAVLSLLAFLAAGSATAAEPLGRLFFTPEQRAQMDIARAQRSRATLEAAIEEQAPAPEILTYHGIVRRSDGKNTVWINDRAINDGKEVGRIPQARPRADGSIVLELPQTERKVQLKVGQSVELLSGTIAEPYAQLQAAPKPAAKPVPERAPPSAASTASEEADRPPGPAAAGNRARASGTEAVSPGR